MDYYLAGTCYCIINTQGAIEQVDVYEDGQKIHHKKFTYDDAGRVIENRMYSPDGNGGWYIADDVWHYEYSPVSGLRTKKIMRMPGAPTAHEISYDGAGNRTSERTIKI